MKKVIKRTIVSLLVISVCFTAIKQPVSAALPGWVKDAIFRVASYGTNYIANNTNMRDYTRTRYDDHSWAVDLKSTKFNNKNSNTGSSAGFRTYIATTWNQSRTRTNVRMCGTKKSFTSGSKYIATGTIIPGGNFVDLGRIQSGSAKQYEAWANNKTLGFFDFRFSYTDSETWDLGISFNDIHYPDVPIDPYSFVKKQGTDNMNHLTYLEADSTINTDKIIIGERMYRVPKDKNVYSINRHLDTERSSNTSKELTLQELIDEKMDVAIDSEVDNFKNYNVGEWILFKDRINSVEYNADRNVTVFKFYSTKETENALEFYGDLTDTYKKDLMLKLKFNVVKIGSLDGFVFESLDYIEDFNYDGDAAPHIDNYLNDIIEKENMW